MKPLSFVLLLLAVSCAGGGVVDDDQPLTLADSLAGRSFLLRFFPVDANDQAAANVAQRFTRSYINLDFNDNGTYLHRSGVHLDSGRWHLFKDTLFWSSNAARLSVQGQSLFLSDSLFVIELIPIQGRGSVVSQ